MRREPLAEPALTPCPIPIAWSFHRCCASVYRGGRSRRIPDRAVSLAHLEQTRFPPRRITADTSPFNPPRTRSHECPCRLSSSPFQEGRSRPAKSALSSSPLSPAWVPSILASELIGSSNVTRLSDCYPIRRLLTSTKSRSDSRRSTSSGRSRHKNSSNVVPTPNPPRKALRSTPSQRTSTKGRVDTC